MKARLQSVTLAAVFLFMAAAVSGCARLGPDFQTPGPGIALPGSFQNQAGSSGLYAEPGEKWWEVFGDPEINNLVNQVIGHNWDIRKASERVLEVSAQFGRARADRFPSISLQGSFRKQSSYSESIIPGAGGRIETDQFNLSLPLTYELDFWGRVARAEEAARASLLQAEEARLTVINSVVSEAVTLYLEMESLERRILIAEKSAADYRRSLELVQARYERGLSTILALKQAGLALAQSESQLPGLKQELGLVQNKLSVLMGRYPENRPARLQPDDYYRRLEPVPAGLPAELLKRRPDIRAAEASLMALNAQIGVAKASRFPTISLTGAFGYSSGELNQLVRPQSELWNLAFNLVHPLFNAGKLEAVQREAEARYRQGEAEYAKTVLTAFAEVEGVLLSREQLLDKREKTLDFLRQAVSTQLVAEDRYNRGLTDYLNVLETQQTRYQAEQSLVLVDWAIFSNRVTLHRALGGGWGRDKNSRAEGLGGQTSLQ